jgi:ATP-dependent RNA helicase DHX33
MFAALPPEQQAKIFTTTAPNTRKCILSTNIAETSITIPGIKYVIDTGKCKEKRYLARDNASSMSCLAAISRILIVVPGFETLLTRDITQSSAVQRAGRAGREVR